MIREIIDRIETRYGAPTPPRVTDLFEQIVWETVCYLVDDEKRAAAFEDLRARVGLTPERIAAAPLWLLEAVACGVRPHDRAHRLKEVARLVLEEHDGDLNRVLSLPAPAALKALRRFPGIGEPGAEKILLFAESHAALALDSNGLRVLLRIGVASEQKSYQASYRAVRDAVQPDLPQDGAWLVAAHQLLRRHGRETCRRSVPECGLCPLRDRCDHFRRAWVAPRPSGSSPPSPTQRPR